VFTPTYTKSIVQGRKAPKKNGKVVFYKHKELLFDHKNRSMTIDISKEYDDGTKSLLKNLRKDIITNLAIHHDHKKILSFLARCALIQIDDQAQDIHVGIPNEFVASQVKKFFGEDMQKSVHQVYGNRFSLRLSVFPPLQKGTHELHIDIKKLLNIDTNKATVPVEQHFKKELTQHF